MTAPAIDLRLAFVFACLLSAAACNSLTGAGDLVIEEEESERSSGDDSSVSTGSDDIDPSTTTTSSTGGGDGTGGGHPDPASTSAATTTAASSSSGGGVVCDYPDSGFGVNVGKYVKSSLAWQGYPKGSNQLSTLTAEDLFDCDGSKGINAILIITSAEWCGVCQDEASDLPSMASTFDAKGIRVVTLMIEDSYGSPADTGTAKGWKDYFGLDGVDVLADPNFSFAGYGSVGLPLQIIVDPRTMEIVARDEGFSGSYAQVISVATQNGG